MRCNIQASHFCIRGRAACAALLMLQCLLISPGSLADSDDGDWVEEKINPSTEWLEEVVSPVTRWMERRIQQPAADVPVIHEAPGAERLPDHVIPPQEAARLLNLLFPGEVLAIHLMDTSPNAYTLKLLSPGGSISTFYMDATDGTLLSQLPPLATQPEMPLTEETTE